MNAQPKSKWLVDAGLFALFIAAFFLDLTGLDLHQWVGVAAGTLAIYHLATHWNWVTAVTRRFFGQTSNKSRLYYGLDAAILAGLGVIAGTGLVISTWLNLPLDNYEPWLTVHIAASIGTLAATVLKLGLHWRWIVTVGKGLVARPSSLGRPVAQRPATGARRMDRRAFLGVMGAIGVPSALALSNAMKGLSLSALGGASAVTPAEPLIVYAAQDTDSTPPPAATSPVATSPALTATVQLETAVTPTTPVATATAAPAATAVPTQSAADSTCTVRCRKGCSYPGRCRRYVDSNGNNKCDLGECL